MREIKFKIWDIKNIEMGGTFSLKEAIQSDAFEVNVTDIFLQFTGLFDKNGKEIFEGDIMLTQSKYDGIKIYWKIFWGKANRHNEDIITWCAENQTGIYWLDKSLQEEAKVIGNIYENPELLVPKLSSK